MTVTEYIALVDDALARIAEHAGMREVKRGHSPAPPAKETSA